MPREDIRGKKLSPAEVERLRRAAMELNLGRHLIEGYHGPRWTEEQLALLGTIPDEEVAAKIAKTEGAVRQKRKKLGIPNLIGRGEWKAEELALLGTVPDREVSQRTGRPLSAVTTKSSELHIPAVRLQRS
jgi:hypothetical protein